MSYWNYIPAAAADGVVYTKMYAVYGNHAVADCDEYDASGNSWTSKTNGPAVTATRQWPGTNTLGGKMYVMGGRDNSPISDTDAYDQAGNSWSTKATYAFGPIFAQYSGVCNAKIYYSGGNNGDPNYGADGQETDTYEYVDDTYTDKSVAGPTKHYVPGMAVGDKLYATHDSGVNETTTISPATDNEVYDPSANTWSAIANEGTGMSRTAAFTADDRVFVATGWGGDGATRQQMDTVEEYSVSGNSWAAKTATPTERADAAGTSLGEGAAAGYVFGDSQSATRDNDEYSVSGNSWTAKADLPAPNRTKLGAAGI